MTPSWFPSALLAVLAMMIPGLPAVGQPQAERLVDREIKLHDAIAVRRVEVGTVEVDAGAHSPAATAGYISYSQPGADASRPVVFAFNGGPGASSAFLHMGALGPWLAKVPSDPMATLPTAFTVSPSSSGLFGLADIVFIDPPGTGFSNRAVDGAESFRTVSGDAEAVAQLVVVWLSEHGREGAPVYIVGESYGTIRAVAMLDALKAQDRLVNVRGIVLLGQALNMIETSQRPDNVITYPVSLPTMAAIACYFNKLDLPCDPQTAAQEAAEFGARDYLPALYRGSELPQNKRDRIASRLAELTGLSQGYYLANNLRVSKERFRLELLRDEGLVLGRYDARYLSPRPEGDPKSVSHDAFSQVSQRIAETVVDHLESRLGVVGAERYRTIARPDGTWSYGGTDSPFADWPFMSIFERHAAANPCLRLFVGTGLYDLTTTVGAADYLFAQSELSPERWRNEVYDAGHLFYSDEDARAKLLSDLAEFIRADSCK